MCAAIRTEGLSASFDQHQAITDITVDMRPGEVTALIGPSGCGKSTLLRCLNGMHLTIAKASVAGTVYLDGVDALDGLDPIDLRKRVGMVFQRPNPFPTMSIFGNVVAGLTLGRRPKRRKFDDVVEQSLRQAGLWNEVRNRLNSPGGGLSGGQQQRLCIARALAVQPEILLLDEPCSALDPISTLAIEDTIMKLKERYTIVIVTHNLQQASRISDTTIFMNIGGEGEPGHVVESGDTKQIFERPKLKETEDYISGRFG